MPEEFFRAPRRAPKLMTQFPESERIYMQDYLLWWPIAEQIRRYFQPRPEFLRRVQRGTPGSSQSRPTNGSPCMSVAATT